MIKLGSHVSFKKPNYLYGAIEESLKNGANCAMIYLGAPQTTLRTNVENYKLYEYLSEFKDLISPTDIVVHAPYITNVANPEKSEFAINFLIEEIERMNYIGAKYLVLHPGSHTSFTRQESIEQLIKSINYILEKTKNVEIIIETMSGKGTEIGTNFDELIYMMKNIKSDRKGICLDTCHIWDAGYNLEKYDEFINLIKEKGVLKYLKVIHLNDSKNPLNSHKDRHANIGEGYIDKKILKKIVHDPLFDNIPIILETPWKDEGPIYDQEIEYLLKLD
ncbi:deoxyribonuclease IV [Mesomycoplasma lagogenitalium]|uniref:Probable endonuclease 4 n=1 Tax=Mesomycoplasma lagogenitalium TaxID=171286 RepID=A0ABY8LUY5_9BACT|nr:deoxyribonuclease IV [Mesomycoplasma lagogenitalium]WGI37043.1 deoxyribonuclease IV [Mesomycoplasma lagogenitalium]